MLLYWAGNLCLSQILHKVQKLNEFFHEKLSGGLRVLSILESKRFWPKDIALGTADVNIVYTLCIWVFDKV